MFNLSICRLEFTVQATTPIEMGEFKGSALRGAWQSYMQQAYCGAPPHARNDPLHQAMCPVCYLTNRETGPEVRRPYALLPPLSRQSRYDAGDALEFGISLFGNAQTLFPYVLLAFREVGETHGIGRYLPEQGQRGHYRLEQVSARDPFTGASQTLLQPGSTMVQMPVISTDDHAIGTGAKRILDALDDSGLLSLHLHTPLRLTDDQRLMHRFQFTVFFQRLLERLYALAEHFSTEPDRYHRQALIADVKRLMPLAAQVEVIQDHTTWWDVKGHSQRKGGTTYLGGLVGKVILNSGDWEPLLPYLLWGSSAQLGKNVVKGGGLFTVGQA